MSNKILVVEDNIQILKNIQIILEFNDFKTESALNGSKAIELLNNTVQLPDLIISDIMMPEMDGYQFFKTVSQNPIWSEIPFIFLSAKVSPEDIRLGKLLGIDDYITKPFKEEDLLASIQGKLIRKQKIDRINEQISKSIGIGPPNEKKDNKIFSSNFWIVYAIWHEAEGPIIKDFYPKEYSLEISLQDLVLQLFQSTVAIYGYDMYDIPETLLLNVKNIELQSFIYFDSLFDDEVRGQHRQFMLSVIAPKISYFNSLKIKSEFSNISALIKSKRTWNIKQLSDKIKTIIKNNN